MLLLTHYKGFKSWKLKKFRESRKTLLLHTSVEMTQAPSFMSHWNVCLHRSRLSLSLAGGGVILNQSAGIFTDIHFPEMCCFKGSILKQFHISPRRTVFINDFKPRVARSPEAFRACLWWVVMWPEWLLVIVCQVKCLNKMKSIREKPGVKE